jgi:hypothetical protein
VGPQKGSRHQHPPCKPALLRGQRPGDLACCLQGMPLGPYMVAFNYGSVVFFGAGPKLRQRALGIARQVAADPVGGERPYVEGGGGTTPLRAGAASLACVASHKNG